MPNRLGDETSPYLLQHAENPVDWYPWGEEALARARAEERPLLVSIGYSACHWCHVMERESFEDDRVAALMNEHFVCVKVDREERPDVDAIYMDACQAMTGHGGWPLNVFITPEGLPFFAGTYFPPTARQGQPSWSQVVYQLAEAWRTRREEILTGSEQIRERLAGAAGVEAAEGALDPAALDAALVQLGRTYDDVHGGFGGAPKFPPHSTLEFLLARGERLMTLRTLRAMANGGIYDQIGGGFARYTVDAAWVVPHFEKMLYDNALLARVYLHAGLASGDPYFERICRETLDFLLRELRQDDGGFASALDADSEGVEGKFYVWTPAEVREALGDRADAAIAAFGMTEAGNFEGANIPVRATSDPPGLAAMKADLLAARERRVRPGLDDKRVCSWNALAISALADAGATLGDDGYLRAAAEAATFVLGSLRDADGRLMRTYNRGQARVPAFLEDHGYLLEALLTLYEATFDPRWFDEARALAGTLLDRFADPERGGFFSTAADGEQLVARRKDLDDAPIPSGSSAAAFGLLRLHALTGEDRWRDAAVGALALVGTFAAQHPNAFGHALQAIDFHVGTVREVALVGPEPERAELERVVRGSYRPRVVLAGGEGAADVPPLLAGRDPVGGAATAYVCEGFACQAPVTDPGALAGLLDG